MSFVQFNPNPKGKVAEDCTVRAIACLTNKTWDDAYILVCTGGLIEKTMPDQKAAIATLMEMLGFVRYELPNTCPKCYTIKQFTYDFPRGKYLVATGSHVVAVIDGNYYDAFDSGNEVPLNYWKGEP
ncbi:MAG: hypothetical protein J6Y02_18435 [Pseudobutyrivibrio sp.]|nr:hypothetical protein [Pseudobutyrivibrio sp.]